MVKYSIRETHGKHPSAELDVVQETVLETEVARIRVREASAKASIFLQLHEVDWLIKTLTDLRREMTPGRPCVEYCRLDDDHDGPCYLGGPG